MKYNVIEAMGLSAEDADIEAKSPKEAAEKYVWQESDYDIPAVIKVRVTAPDGTQTLHDVETYPGFVFDVGQRVQSGADENHEHGTILEVVPKGYMVEWKSGVKSFLEAGGVDEEVLPCEECRRIAREEMSLERYYEICEQEGGEK